MLKQENANYNNDLINDNFNNNINKEINDIKLYFQNFIPSLEVSLKKANINIEIINNLDKNITYILILNFPVCTNQIVDCFDKLNPLKEEVLKLKRFADYYNLIAKENLLSDNYHLIKNMCNRLWVICKTMNKANKISDFESNCFVLRIKLYINKLFYFSLLSIYTYAVKYKKHLNCLNIYSVDDILNIIDLSNEIEYNLTKFIYTDIFNKEQVKNLKKKNFKNNELNNDTLNKILLNELITLFMYSNEFNLFDYFILTLNKRNARNSKNELFYYLNSNLNYYESYLEYTKISLCKYIIIIFNYETQYTSEINNNKVDKINSKNLDNTQNNNYVCYNTNEEPAEMNIDSIMNILEMFSKSKSKENILKICDSKNNEINCNNNNNNNNLILYNKAIVKVFSIVDNFKNLNIAKYILDFHNNNSILKTIEENLQLLNIVILYFINFHKNTQLSNNNNVIIVDNKDINEFTIENLLPYILINKFIELIDYNIFLIEKFNLDKEIIDKYIEKFIIYINSKIDCFDIFTDYINNTIEDNKFCNKLRNVLDSYEKYISYLISKESECIKSNYEIKISLIKLNISLNINFNAIADISNKIFDEKFNNQNNIYLDFIKDNPIIQDLYNIINFLICNKKNNLLVFSQIIAITINNFEGNISIAKICFYMIYYILISNLNCNLKINNVCFLSNALIDIESISFYLCYFYFKCDIYKILSKDSNIISKNTNNLYELNKSLSQTLLSLISKYIKNEFQFNKETNNVTKINRHKLKLSYNNRKKLINKNNNDNSDDINNKNYTLISEEINTIPDLIINYIKHFYENDLNKNEYNNCIKEKYTSYLCKEYLNIVYNENVTLSNNLIQRFKFKEIYLLYMSILEDNNNYLLIKEESKNLESLIEKCSINNSTTILEVFKMDTNINYYSIITLLIDGVQWKSNTKINEKLNLIKQINNCDNKLAIDFTIMLIKIFDFYFNNYNSNNIYIISDLLNEFSEYVVDIHNKYYFEEYNELLEDKINDKLKQILNFNYNSFCLFILSCISNNKEVVNPISYVNSIKTFITNIIEKIIIKKYDTEYNISNTDFNVINTNYEISIILLKLYSNISNNQKTLNIEDNSLDIESIPDYVIKSILSLLETINSSIEFVLNFSCNINYSNKEEISKYSLVNNILNEDSNFINNFKLLSIYYSTSIKSDVSNKNDVLYLYKMYNNYTKSYEKVCNFIVTYQFKSDLEELKERIKKNINDLTEITKTIQLLLYIEINVMCIDYSVNSLNNSNTTNEDFIEENSLIIDDFEKYLYNFIIKEHATNKKLILIISSILHNNFKINKNKICSNFLNNLLIHITSKSDTLGNVYSIEELIYLFKDYLNCNNFESNSKRENEHIFHTLVSFSSFLYKVSKKIQKSILLESIEFILVYILDIKSNYINK